MITEQESKIKLYWLYKIRLVTNLASIFVFILGFTVMALDLKVWPIICLFSLSLMTNQLFRYLFTADKFEYSYLISIVLTFDILWLTLCLYFYGGYTNPFSVLYLFYISLAAIFLNRNWTWVTYLLSIFFYGLLFFFYQSVDELSMHGHHQHGHNAGFSLHLQGMYIGFLLIGAILSFFLSKMSEEVRYAAEINKILKDKQAQESKLLGLASLTAGAAHELSTPVGTIKLITENLLDTYSNNKDLAAEISQIDTEVERCEKVLKRMRLKGFDLPAEVTSEFSLRQIHKQLEQDFVNNLNNLQFINFDHDIKIRSLYESLVESLSALIKNALEASEHKQIVTAEFVNSQRDYVFLIRDSGSGISSEVMTRLGDPFVSTKANGMGLGIFLVRLFAKRVAAELNISSDKKGTIFSLSIPKAA